MPIITTVTGGWVGGYGLERHVDPLGQRLAQRPPVLHIGTALCVCDLAQQAKPRLLVLSGLDTLGPQLGYQRVPHALLVPHLCGGSGYSRSGGWA